MVRKKVLIPTKVAMSALCSCRYSITNCRCVADLNEDDDEGSPHGVDEHQLPREWTARVGVEDRTQPRDLRSWLQPNGSPELPHLAPSEVAADRKQERQRV